MKVAVEPLDPKRHDRGAFSCGAPALDRFLRETASQAAHAFRSQTFVLVDSANPSAVMGFYSLAYHEYRDAEMDAATARALKAKNLKRIPTILLGQLAVASEWQGKRLGPMLLEHALRRSLVAACQLGGVAVITDPIDDAAARFYGKYGFVRLVPEDPRMLLPMKLLRELYPGVVRAAREPAPVG
ncbi:MAG TPA: GNAT family N-acetyltransferase [Candidatus Elarobacter sp.]|nr:GNAT family N-acetyltransferase [Candidatus Elarobacter sp.]